MLKKCLVAALFISMGSVAKAQDVNENEILCSYYAKMGAIVTDYMLPLTFGDVIDMIGGKNPKILAGLTDILLKSVNGTELVSLNNLSQEDQSLLGEASGQVGFQLLMTGQASSSEEVRAMMSQSCLSNGIQAIIGNQRIAKELVEKSMRTEN